MKAVVVYESLWGNTAAVARSIAEGIGPDARALATDEASPEILAQADLIVAGAPVIAFRLPTDSMRASVEKNRLAPPADLSHPSMQSWLKALPKGHAGAAAFETRIWWSPGGSTGAISKAMTAAGYHSVAKAAKFVVAGKYGPLRDGELDRARAWGSELARAMTAGASS
jgi:hypothetical protein